MEKIVICFEVNNRQEEYSALMQIIDAIENGTEIRILEQLQSICNVRYCWLRGRNTSINNQLEITEKIEAEIAGENKEQDWKLYPLRQLEKVVEKRSEYEFRYYVRVHTTDDVKNAQYPVLILQQFQMLKGKIQFFFIPFSDYYAAESIQWKSVNTYYKYSHFLRFVLLEYRHTFLGAYYNNNVKRMEIRNLSSKKKGIQSSFFPLIEIDQSILDAITKYFTFEMKQTVYSGKPILSELLEISEKILWTRLKEAENSEVAKKKLEQINKELSHQYVTILEYAVFCVLVPEKDELTEDVISVSMKRSKNIADGLIQIIENIILHSYNHKGIFTFRITGINSKWLEIDISDANIEETIIDNFKKKLGEAEKYFDNTPIYISQFFGHFEKEEEKEKLAWKKYRDAYPIKCLGLQRLAHELKRCSASFKVRSNTSYENNKENLLYIVNRNGNMKASSDLYIPGTQYQIIMPIASKYVRPKQHNANVFLNAIGGLLETDAVYAKFIDYDLRNIKYSDLCSSKMNIADLDKYYYDILNESIGNRKEQMINLWGTSWDNWVEKTKLEENRIYYLDLMGIHELTSPWGIEVFCKGLVQSKVVNCTNIRYFALINANEEFMKMFFETIVFSNLPLNQKQFYIHVDNNNEILICGNNKDEIYRNAFQYCFSKGKIPEFLPECITGETEQNIEICPFDVLLKQEGCEQTLFEKYIENVADELLTSGDMAGYKLINSHMRLGNKVHLKDFYELSILFRKPHISKKIALLLIRDMVENGIDVMQDMLFYGYASYSRTILISLVEIMKQYHVLRGEQDHFVDFAVYQNDIVIQKTLTDISPKVRMYFSTNIPQNGHIKIVQIVPISTTLTTFKKMWDMFCEDMPIENRPLHPEKNYTIFWVRDLGEKKEISAIEEKQPTEIEEEYWSEIKEDKTIVTDLIKTNPRFFCCKKTKWFNPLSCECCYPENILDEVALIETDVTSTVPSQQLELIQKNPKSDMRREATAEELCNENRVINLQNCIYYGHISRDGNHFQYYIDTVAYFQKQKEEIKKWLQEKAIVDKEEINGKGTFNIIITPHNHTNVEFGHYVNEYYFNGTADIVTIDSSKEYRSNIIVKYADIKKAIYDAYKIEMNVRFIFVDDSIITGTTFKRVNSLLHSLVPDEKINLLQINKVFVLINRMSSYSKLDYVRDINRDFYAFTNLNISSIRNYGDSCTMCTLQRNSQLFRKRASTFEIAKYWDGKQKDYTSVSFDRYEDKKKMEQGYIRMLCSHYAKSNLNITEDMVSSICNIIDLMLKLRENNTESPIYNKVLLKDKKNALKAYLKILVRPFFSYGRIYRQAIIDLLLLMAEYFLNPKFKTQLDCGEISEKKEYMNNEHLRKQVRSLCCFIEEIITENEKFDFIQKYLLEGLTDLRSNYIIRKNTLENICEFIIKRENQRIQYSIYSQMVHRLINSSADETKSLWLEYLLTTGLENQTSMNGYDKITLAEIWNDSGDSRKFWETLFIENTRLCYDSMLNFVKKADSIVLESRIAEPTAIVESVRFLWGDYYIRNLRRFIKIEILAEGVKHYNSEYVEQEIQEKVKRMTELLWLLKKETRGGLERYEKLKECVEQLLYKNDQLQIFTMAENELCPVTDYKKGIVSQKISTLLEQAKNDEYFKKKGFYIDSNYIIICVSNLNQHFEKQIQPLYFYIQCEETDAYRMILRVRKILMYRNQILHWIEADFNNNALPVLVEQMSANRQLMRDKAGDHSSRTDISSIERLLQTEYNSNKLENLYRWMLLRQYVNMRIARVFRSEWSKDSEDTRDKLYTLKENSDGMNGPMMNLGESLFGYTSAGMSPKWYFKAIFNMFEFTICIDGKVYSSVSMETMKDLFNKMNGREENGYYYKQEYIICIILDIMFSAIKTCRNWAVDYDEHLDCLGEMRSLIRENEMMTCFDRLGNGNGKCKIRIERDSSYLIFRNMVAGMRENEVNKKNKLLYEQFRIKDTKGLSLQTIKWYVENLGEMNDRDTVFKYEWNEKDKQVEFVTKLPILKKGEKVK